MSKDIIKAKAEIMTIDSLLIVIGIINYLIKKHSTIYIVEALSSSGPSSLIDY